MSKLTMLAAGGVGYVLGAKAGRTRYEQIRNIARKISGNPTVQSVVEKAEEAVAYEASVVKEKVASAASMAWPRREGDEPDPVGATSARETGWPTDNGTPQPPIG